MTIKYRLYLNDDGPKVKASVMHFGGSTTSRHHDSVVVDPQDLPTAVRRHFTGQLAATKEELSVDG